MTLYPYYYIQEEIMEEMFDLDVAKLDMKRQNVH